MVCRPPFHVEITKGKTVLALQCSFPSAYPEDEEYGKERPADEQISEFTLLTFHLLRSWALSECDFSIKSFSIKPLLQQLRGFHFLLLIECLKRWPVSLYFNWVMRYIETKMATFISENKVNFQVSFLSNAKIAKTLWTTLFVLAFGSNGGWVVSTHCLTGSIIETGRIYFSDNYGYGVNTTSLKMSTRKF